MAQNIEAVYEDGVFKPLQPVTLREGERVQICLPADTTPEPESVLGEGIEQKMQALGYGTFADVPDAEWEEIAEGWKRGSFDARRR